MFLTALFAASCTDGNDWDVDPSYDRLFSVNAQSLSIDADVYSAALEWSNTPNTDYYVIEISKDSLTDEVTMGQSNGSVVFGEDKTITSSPDTLTNLEPDTKYFIRMKALSNSGEGGSNWAYPTKYSFKTKAENIFTETTIKATTATVAWDVTKEANRLGYVATGAKDTTFVTLADADKKAGTYTIKGLKSETKYTVVIYNNTVKRGTVSFQTNPDGVTITTPEELNDILTNPEDYLDENGGLTILLDPGTTIDYTNESFKRTIPATVKSVKFTGKAGSEKATLKLANFEFAGDHPLIAFSNLKLTSSDGTGYVLNQDAQDVEGTVGEFKIENCEISKLGGVVRVKGGTSTIKAVTIDNCIMNSIGQYGIVQNGTATATISNATVSNSTVYNGAIKGVVISKGNADMSILIESCTFYNAFASSNQYVIDDNNKNATFDIKINKVIFAKSDNMKAIRNNKKAPVSESYSLGDFTYNGTNNFNGQTKQLSGSEKDIFTDPNNGDFTIKSGAISGAGDPRWLK